MLNYFQIDQSPTVWLGEGVEPEITQAEARDREGRWLPGTSGNPGGQSKGLVRLRAAAREYTQEALNVLVEGLGATKLYGKDGLEHPDWPSRITAANALLDRGWGRVGAASDGFEFGSDGSTRPSVDLTRLSPDEFKQFRDLAMKARAEGKL